MADIELIVKISEEKYNKFMYSDDVDEEELVEAFEYLMNGTPIPDNVTNGDVVEKDFGKDVYCTLIRMMYSSCCEKLKDWWNAPYQKGGTNGND